MTPGPHEVPPEGRPALGGEQPEQPEAAEQLRGRGALGGEQPEPAEPREGEPRPGTIGFWFWGSLLGFGVFLVLVPGRDPRARFWLVAGLVLALASLVALVRTVVTRARRSRSRP
ncbi:hypothetical protein GCM10027517_37450 [Phycicoccus ginsengisoli]